MQRPVTCSLLVAAFLTAVMATAIRAVAWDRGNPADYHERRAHLVSETSGGVVVLFGYNDADVAASVTRFHQPESGEDAFQADTVAKLRKIAPLAAMEDVRPLVSRMRMIKSPGEIALIRRAVEASMEAHLAAMKAVQPGKWEYDIAALMKYEF